MSQKNPFRIGVTGSGFMGRTHVEAAQRIEIAVPVAVAGGRRAQQLAADYGIDCEPDAQALASRDDLDGIVVATPHYVHGEETLLAAAAGKHVLVEKPLATTLEDCDRMIDACREAGVTLGVGYHQRFRELNYRTRQLLAEGAIGPVRCIQTSALFDIETMRRQGGFGPTPSCAWSWWTDPRSVAHLINGGPHTIDLCRWWLRQDVAAVSAHCGTFREQNPNENTTMALLSFTGGAFCTLWSSSVAPAPGFAGEEFRFRIMGDDGLLDVDPYHDLRIARGGKWETVCSQPKVEFESADGATGDIRMEAYCDQLRAFIDAATGQQKEGAIPIGDGRDGRAGVAAVLAMLESSRRGERIHISD